MMYLKRHRNAGFVLHSHSKQPCLLRVDGNVNEVPGGPAYVKERCIFALASLLTIWKGEVLWPFIMVPRRQQFLKIYLLIWKSQLMSSKGLELCYFLPKGWYLLSFTQPLKTNLTDDVSNGSITVLSQDAIFQAPGAQQETNVFMDFSILCAYVCMRYRLIQLHRQ